MLLISWIVLIMFLVFVWYLMVSEFCLEKSNFLEFGFKINEDFVDNCVIIINCFEDILLEDDFLVFLFNDYRGNMESDFDNFENLVRKNVKI